MRSKTPLILMEQLVMVLVFALAAAICLRIFVYAEGISKRNEALATAALLAQNTAEELKMSRGEALLDWEDGEACMYTERDGLRMEVQESASVDGLREVCLRVFDQAELLFEIPVAWQEVKGDG